MPGHDAESAAGHQHDPGRAGAVLAPVLVLGEPFRDAADHRDDHRVRRPVAETGQSVLPGLRGGRGTGPFLVGGRGVEVSLQRAALLSGQEGQCPYSGAGVRAHDHRHARRVALAREQVDQRVRVAFGHPGLELVDRGGAEEDTARLPCAQGLQRAAP